MCVCIDRQQFFFGQCHTVLGRNPSTKLPSICRKDAFDIETQKAPLNSSHVEAVELGVFQLNLGAVAQIVDDVRPTMEHDELRNDAKIADIGAGMADFDAVSVQIDAVLLQALIERPLRTELPHICHLSDVGAMFPNIILTNLIEEVCMACIHNVPEARCKCPLQWVWRGEIEFCRNAFKRLRDTEEVQQQRRMTTTTIYHRKIPSLHVDTDEPTFRYKYKQMRRKICITHNQSLLMEEKQAQTDLNSGKTELIKLVAGHSDENSLKLHLKSLSNFFMLNGVAVSQSVDDLSSVPIFKNAVAEMTDQLPHDLKTHRHLFTTFRTIINCTKSQLRAYRLHFLESVKNANSHEEFFTRPEQSAGVCEYLGEFFTRPGQPADAREHLDGKLRSAKIKLFNYAYLFGNHGALQFHIEIVESFIDSLIDQSRLFNSISVNLCVAGNEGLPTGQSSSNSSVFGAQQKESSVGPSFSSPVVDEQQQQKDSSGVSSAQQHGQKRANTTDQCQHPPKKERGGNK